MEGYTFFFSCVDFFPTQLSTTSDSLSESLVFLNICLHPIIQIQAHPMDVNFQVSLSCFFPKLFCLPAHHPKL